MIKPFVIRLILFDQLYNYLKILIFLVFDNNKYKKIFFNINFTADYSAMIILFVIFMIYFSITYPVLYHDVNNQYHEDLQVLQDTE